MKSTSLALISSLLVVVAKGAVITGSVSDFTGPDDLLLDPATNVVAVDSFGQAGSLTVNGVTFQSDAATGIVSGGGATVTTTSGFTIPAWSTATPPSYTGADATSVANLERIMHSIRWSLAPGAVSVDITGLSDSSIYNVQLLFSENGSTADRHWDIGVDGVLVVDDVNSNSTTLSTGRVYSGDFSPGGDGTLNIVMAQEPFPGDPNNTGLLGADNNPILHAVIIHEVVPEPSGLALLGIGLAGFLLRRRRS